MCCDEFSGINWEAQESPRRADRGFVSFLEELIGSEKPFTTDTWRNRPTAGTNNDEGPRFLIEQIVSLKSSDIEDVAMTSSLFVDSQSRRS